MKKTYAIILGGGMGKRSKSNIPKQLTKIGSKTILEITVEKFNENRYIDEIILVLNSEYKEKLIKSKKLDKYKKISQIVQGGKTRRESSFNGLNLIKDIGSKVLIHDAVRPFLSHKTINRCVEALENYKAVYPGVPSADTIIKVDSEAFIEDIPIRKHMMRGQTPQGFLVETIKKAHLLAQEDSNVDEEVTNDCGLIKRYNICKIKVVEGNRNNIKITYPEDLILIKKLFTSF